MARIKARKLQIRLLGEDRNRVLLFDGNAMVRVEELTGLNLLKDTLAIPTMKAPLDFLLKFLVACLEHEDPTITAEYIGARLLPKQVPEAFVIMGKLMGQESDPKQLAPFVPTDEAVVRYALKVAKLATGEKFVDIGCGDGRTLEIALRDYKAGRVDGYEMNPERAELCANRLVTEYCGQYTIWQHNFMDMPEEAYEPLKHADVIFVYLLTTANTTIAPVLEKYCKRGCRVVSHDFAFNGWEGYASEQIQEAGRLHRVYAYTIGDHKDTPLAQGEVVPDVSPITRAGWITAEKGGKPVFRYGDVGAVVWDRGKWWARLAGPGSLPMGPYEDPQDGMAKVEEELEKKRKPEPDATTTNSKQS